MIKSVVVVLFRTEQNHMAAHVEIGTMAHPLNAKVLLPRFNRNLKPNNGAGQVGFYEKADYFQRGTKHTLTKEYKAYLVRKGRVFSKEYKAYFDKGVQSIP